jgi:hypothetical protein
VVLHKFSGDVGGPSALYGQEQRGLGKISVDENAVSLAMRCEEYLPGS